VRRFGKAIPMQDHPLLSGKRSEWVNAFEGK
jgi:hypothetical protein